MLFRSREADVVWTYSGVRPLYDDGASKAQEATRDYVLTLDAGEGRAPLLSVFGGKITTYRRLAEAALDKLAPFLPAQVKAKGGWTAGAALCGGDFATDGFDALVAGLRGKYAFLSSAHATRLARAYGTQAEKILAGSNALTDLGRSFGADLTGAEVDYLMREEWAARAEDVLWRRGKLGLRVSPAEAAALDAYMTAGIARQPLAAGARA